MVRGVNEDILPLLYPEARVVERIQAQIDAAKDFRAECHRKDEGYGGLLGQTCYCALGSRGHCVTANCLLDPGPPEGR
jgi:hypothetical protein